MLMRRATWVADTLRDAGRRVVEHDGWRSRGDAFTDLHAIVWHHDGSPVGATPSVPEYMIGQIDKGKPGAQLWVALDGTWHVLASGKVSHAGDVLPGKPGNSTSLGIETDHTTGETWSGVELLHSLRIGSAAILKRLSREIDQFEFHKTVCEPVGRKSDPDGLDLGVERAAVNLILHPPSEEEDMARKFVVPDPFRSAPAAGRQPHFIVVQQDNVHEVSVARLNGSKFGPEAWEEGQKTENFEDFVFIDLKWRKYKNVAGLLTGAFADETGVYFTAEGTPGTYAIAVK